MKHARPDYDRFQDPLGKIPHDEPVFLIRAQDIVAPNTVSHWADEAESHGASPEIIQAARKQAAKMVEWQLDHRIKVPDLPNETS